MRWVVVLMLSGCSSILGIDDFKLGDAGSTGGDGETGFCLGAVGWRVCVAEAPTAPIDNPSTFMFNTNNSPKLCQGATWASPAQPDACFTVATQVTISAALQATGDRPYVIFASDSITIDAPLDVASHVGGSAKSGPGVPAQGRCVAPQAAGNGSAGGGAAGGSFMTKGGDGGSPTAAGVINGKASAADATAPALMRPGCNGGEGGDTTAEQGGAQGLGGGAIYLVAGNRITINSIINASGSPGGGSGRAAGGGGGGSGGMIILFAPMITGNGGVLIANGGGGGGGGGPQLGGTAGSEPVPNMPSNVALGGAGGSPGGAGGNGFAGVREATVGVNGSVGASSAGGGGGGGAAGFIRANQALVQITTSPAVSPP